MNGHRYDRIAIALHWAMALLIGLNLGLGFWMQEAIDVAQTRATAARVYQWHKSIGLLLLLLAAFRLAWRLASPSVAVPGGRWQRLLASGTHGLLYALMVLLPLTGWLMVSAQWRGDGPLTVPTQWFGLFDVPHLLGLASAPESLREQVWRLSMSAHEAGGWLMLALLAGHVTAAIMHGRRARSLQRAPVADPASMGFRMRWQAAGPARVSRQRLVAWMSLIAAVLAIPALIHPYAADGDSLVSQSDWPPQLSPELPVWELDRDQSAILFSGALNGESFEGRFDRWDAHIALNPKQPELAMLWARIQTGSATNGVPLHDRTLKEAEWFDVQRHPYARFELTALESLNGSPDRYQLRGLLTIKGETVPVTALTMTVSDGQMQIAGKLQLDRTALNMGMASDPDGEYVSRMITVEVQVRAHRPRGA